MPEVGIPVIDQNFGSRQQLDVGADEILKNCVVVNSNDA
jgi:hypothetical protein